MSEPITFYSTNRGGTPVTLREALLIGQAADRGLFMPSQYPRFQPRELLALKSRSYAQIAWAVLRRFTSGMISDETLARLCDDAYDFEVPIEQVTKQKYIMRLDRGPTASFKDFAARMMARWMGVFMEGDSRELIILTATSGDTGSAVAHAYHGVPRVQIVVLFPIDEVSTRQRKQMTTLGGNVLTLAVDGKFDDCQALVKRAFSDPELGHLQLSSANSINIGRLLPQAVYYVYAGAKLATESMVPPMVFSVPSGNFGDMMGAVIARKLGLPISRLVVATNANDEVPRFLATGEYQKIVPSRVCISNAMNVGHPSNLARLVDAYGGWMDETGRLRERPDMAAMQRDLYSISISDAETRATIQSAYREHHVMLEPHGAVGWAGLERYQPAAGADPESLGVAVETAHPAKFPEEIRALLGVEPPTPPSLIGIEERAESFERMAVDYDHFQGVLRQRFDRT